MLISLFDSATTLLWNVKKIIFVIATLANIAFIDGSCASSLVETIDSGEDTMETDDNFSIIDSLHSNNMVGFWA